MKLNKSLRKNSDAFPLETQTQKLSIKKMKSSQLPVTEYAPSYAVYIQL
jgi:hypothetical protein